jgi:hypothetical protein
MINVGSNEIKMTDFDKTRRLDSSQAEDLRMLDSLNLGHLLYELQCKVRLELDGSRR